MIFLKLINIILLVFAANKAMCDSNYKNEPLKRVRLMGIINLTPVSMSGENKLFTDEELQQEIVNMANQGADIIDIGAESTRPKAEVITIEQEWKRLKPLLKNLNKILSDPRLRIKPQISIDTYHFETVQKLMDYDIDIINDISGIDLEKIIPLLKDTHKKYVLTHNMGKAGGLHMGSTPEDIVADIISWFKRTTDKLLKLGLNKSQIIIDPGIGFGKTKEQTLEIIKNIEQFKSLGFPILVGHSRKASALPAVANLSPLERDLETAWLSKELSQKGTDFVRVHNVALNKLIIDGKISLIVAHQLDNGIGIKGSLPWKLQEDMNHFRTITLNKTIIMGRKTFEAIGHPLKNRRNIVLSKTLSPIKGIEIYPSLQEAFTHITPEEEIFIIGGAQVFADTVKHADYLYRTIVKAHEPTDVFFPEIDEKNWILETERSVDKDKKNEYSYIIQKLRIRNE